MGAQAESTPCRVRTAIAAYFDRRIETTTRRAESAESEQVRELALTLVARHTRNKGHVLATHFSECRTCGGGIAEPIRCAAYQGIAAFMGREIAKCAERMKNAKGKTRRTQAEIAMGHAKITQARYLRAHLGKCKVCT